MEEPKNASLGLVQDSASGFQAVPNETEEELLRLFRLLPDIDKGRYLEKLEQAVINLNIMN